MNFSQIFQSGTIKGSKVSSRARTGLGAQPQIFLKFKKFKPSKGWLKKFSTFKVELHFRVEPLLELNLFFRNTLKRCLLNIANQKLCAI